MVQNISGSSGEVLIEADRVLMDVDEQEVWMVFKTYGEVRVVCFAESDTLAGRRWGWYKQTCIVYMCAEAAAVVAEP